MPFGLIADFAVIGYVDDFGVLMAALFQLAMYVDDDVKNQARNKLKDLFGEVIIPKLQY